VPQPVHIAYAVDSGAGHYGPSAQEEGYLAHGVENNLQTTSKPPLGGKKHCPQYHAGKMGDCGVGKPPLNLILPEGEQRGKYNGYSTDYTENGTGTNIMEERWAGRRSQLF